MDSHEKLDIHLWRDFGASLTATFTFIRENIRELLRSLIFISGPVLLISGMVMGFFFREYFSLSYQFDNGPFQDETVFENWLITTALSAIFTFITYSIVSIVLFEFMHLYAESPDKKVTMEEVWVRVRKDFFRLMLAKLIMLPMILVSMMCLYLPGLFVYALLGAVEMIMIDKGVNPFKGIGESFDLMGKYFWMTVGLVVVTFLIQGIASAIFQVPVAIIESLEGLAMIDKLEGSGWDTFLKILGGFAQMIGYVLYAIPTITLGIRYYAVKEHRDGTRLLARVRKIGRERPNLDIYREDEQY